jgi:Acetoacetate decarboxylase (ADC)
MEDGAQMAGSEDLPAIRRDPWPSPQPSWQDPPWVMTGRVLTTWFEAPWAVLAASMSPELWPKHTPRIRIRLRFYELRFRTLGRNEGQALAPAEGPFRECAVGFPARARGMDGEASLFLWTESDTYLMWAREAFGWPVARGRIELSGSIWTSSALAGTSGVARLEDAWGSAAIARAEVQERAGQGSPAALWFTPRRVLRRAGLDGDLRELLVVRPTVRAAGARYVGAASVVFDFDASHPLGGLGEAEAELELVDGFELVVGDNVEIW